MGAWYDTKTQAEVMNRRICTQLQNGVGTFGLTGVDRFFSFMIVKELQNVSPFSVLFSCCCLVWLPSCVLMCACCDA